MGDLSGSFNTSGYYGGGAPDYLTFSWTATQDIATNTSTVTWTVKAYGGNTSAYYNTLFQRYTKVGNTTKQTDMNNPGTQTVYNGTVVYSGTETITHNQDGTGSFTATVRASFEYWNTNFNSTGSQTFTLKTIPRAATITSAPNFTDTDDPTIQYSNPAGTVAALQAAISLDGTTAAVPYRNVSSTGTSYTFSLTDAERNTLRNGTATSQNITVYFLLKTTIGTSVFVKNLAKTFTINNNANNKPTVSNTVSSIDNTAIPIRDPDGNTNDHRSEFNNIIVQKYSKLAITVSASGKYNATIASISTSFDNNSYSGSSFTSSTVMTSGTLAISSSVTDSRGFSNSYSRDVISYSYTDPTLTGVRVFRCDSGGTAADSGTYLKIEATKGFESVNNKNQAILRYRWRKGTGSWSAWITLLDYGSSSNSYSSVVSPTTFDVTSTYDIQISVLDYINKEVRSNANIPTEIVTFHWKRGGKSVGIGTYAGNDNTVTIAWPTTIDGNVLSKGPSAQVQEQDTSHNGSMYAGFGSGHQNHGVYSSGYAPTATSWTSSGKWMIYRDSNGDIKVNGNADTATKLGTSNIGGTQTPIYLNSGAPTACYKPASGHWFRGVAEVQSDGVMEIGRYIDFHATNTSTADYTKRIDAGTSTNSNIVKLPDWSGTMALNPVLLWTNSTPGTYSGGTLNISTLNQFTHVIIAGWAWGESLTGYFENSIKIGASGMLFYGGMNSSTASSAANFINMTFRPVTVNSNNIVLSNGSQVYNGSAYYDNWPTRCVPVWIWGVTYATN